MQSKTQYTKIYGRQSSSCGTTELVASLECWTQVLSQAQHSGLRIRHCHSCSVGCNWGLDLIPSPETPYAGGWPKKEKRKKKSLNLSREEQTSYQWGDCDQEASQAAGKEMFMSS